MSLSAYLVKVEQASRVLLVRVDGWKWKALTPGMIKYSEGNIVSVEDNNEQDTYSYVFFANTDDEGSRVKVMRWYGTETAHWFCVKMTGGTGTIYPEGAATMTAGFISWTKNVTSSSDSVADASDDGSSDSYDTSQDPACA
jgi:hypothetical protein